MKARGCNGLELTGKSQRVVRVTGKRGINSGGAGAAGGFDDGAHGVCVQGNGDFVVVVCGDAGDGEGDEAEGEGELHFDGWLGLFGRLKGNEVDWNLAWLWKAAG